MIRRMEEADLCIIHKIEKQIFSNPWSKQSFLTSLNQAYYICLVFEDKKEIKGYCILSFLMEEGELLNIAVREKDRNKNYGKMLLKEGLRIGRAQGGCTCLLEVRENNKNAIKFYEKFGFEKIGIRKNLYEQPRENGIVMKKKLE